MHKIEDLIRKCNAGECTAEEKLILEQWYQSFDWSNKSSLLFEDNIGNLKEEVWLAIQHSKIFPNKHQHNRPSPFSTSLSSLKGWYYAAAAVIVITGSTLVFYISKPVKENNPTPFIAGKPAVLTDVLPGTSKAQLILDNGSVIALDSARNMQLKEEDGTHIDKQSGKLVYNNATIGNGRILFNTLSTPRGGEYRLELPDGSKVWLNAASSIRFPTRFEGKERIVFLQGEAYFEVAKYNRMPFHVKLDNAMTVEALGTHFNIMSYSDEAEIKTTLTEGIVKVVNQNKAALLASSQQAVMKRGDQSLTVGKADVGKALAWKNGMIEFEEDDLPYIMRQLSRWYNVDVSFADVNLKGTYKGAIRRQSPLSKVLEILRVAGVQFKMEGKTLVVTGG